jgi:L-alanine-DL-glutamate epimerase-like enolase superfamily enzyme
MSTIQSVEARTLRVPLDQPTSFSKREVRQREYVVVRVTGEEGVTGIGFCYAGNRAGKIVALAVRELLAPVVLGEESFRVEGLWHAMYQESLLHGRTGSVMRALSILDIALWDHNARAVGLPLYKFLGSYAQNTVPAYASGGYYLPGKTAADLGAEMAAYVADGFTAVKMKVGRAALAEERERLSAARAAIGDDALLMLDANNAWRDLPSALRFMEMAAPFSPYWIEEPFLPDDIDNHRRLAERSEVPVATGEIEAGRWRFKELLAKEAAMVLQTDAAVCGGITEFRRIAATAASYGVDLAPHWFHDLHVHLVGATPNASFVEFFPNDQVLNFRKLVDTQLEVVNGALALPAGPGLGFDFDAAALETYALDDWQ